MTKRATAGAVVAIAACLLLVHANLAAKEAAVHHAKGTFDVKLNALKPEESAGDPAIGKMSIDKQFHGDIEGTSKGQMLAFSTEVKGSAGYVAMERVTATIGGRSGAFVLQHSATMNRGVPQLSITVVPDSASGELHGLTGAMTIDITEGKHFYDFEYSLPEVNAH
jgi:hypothetical protein